MGFKLKLKQRSEEVVQDYCEKCHQFGHTFRDCGMGITCYKCGKVGHHGRNCTEDIFVQSVAVQSAKDQGQYKAEDALYGDDRKKTGNEGIQNWDERARADNEQDNNAPRVLTEQDYEAREKRKYDLVLSPEEEAKKALKEAKKRRKEEKKRQHEADKKLIKEYKQREKTKKEEINKPEPSNMLPPPLPKGPRPGLNLPPPEVRQEVKKETTIEDKKRKYAEEQVAKRKEADMTKKTEEDKKLRYKMKKQKEYFEPPSWASVRTDTKLYISVEKDGRQVESWDISDHPYYLIGKNSAVVDFTMDHPSVSRTHVAVIHDATRKTTFIQDLKSQWGTKIESKKCAANEPLKLPLDVPVKIAGSSRILILKVWIEEKRKEKKKFFFFFHRKNRCGADAFFFFFFFFFSSSSPPPFFDILVFHPIRKKSTIGEGAVGAWGWGGGGETMKRTTLRYGGEEVSSSWWEIDCLGNKVFSAILEKARREGESSDEVIRKMLLVPPAIIMFCVFVLLLIYEIVFFSTSGPLRLTLSCVVCTTLLAVCINAIRLKTLTMRLVEVGVCVLMIATILSDLVNVGLYEQWFIAVLLMDVLLLTNPDPRLAWTLYGMTMSWIVLRTAEDASRFGMYEHIPYNEDNQPRPAEGWSWGFPILVLRCGVFGLDHALTRRFAVGMKKERERLDTSVIMAEEVADALIRFDLIRAESLISSQDVAIKDSFIRLLENLKMYRPYLPPTIFCGGDEDAYLRKEDSNSYFVPIPGAVMPNQDPTSPASLTQTQTEIELEEITVTDAKLRENLEVGVRVRKGSVLRTAFDTISLEVQDTFALVAPFAEVCLQEVKNWGGVVLHLNGSVLLAGWNTHLPCPRHSLHAVRCSLILGNSLTSSPTAFPHHCCVTACGRLAVGSTGTEFIRSPFVLGNPVVQVEAMSILCRPLDCTQIITEGVYEATRTQVNGRLIDVIPEIPCPYAGNLDSIGLYELCDFFPFERTQYMNAFIAFSVNKPESVDLFQEYLKECPGDVQAARILKLALAARDRPEFLPIPYVRSMVGWKMLEQEAEGILPEDVKALFSFKREVKRVPELPPPMLEQDQLLKALHAAASKRNSMHDNFEFVDLEGSRWYRSGKSLGSGSFGEVWLGMGEDGGLVAMKWLAVSGPKDFDTITNLSKCSGESSKKSPSVRSMTSFTDQRLKERLEEVKKEVELLSKLKHENIVCYLSVAAVQTSIVINMEYVPGGSLQNLLEQFGILPLSSVQRYVKDILKGFRYLHKTNVAHRDFKPGNVLVQIDGQCKLSDFGASAALSDVMGRNVVGTLLYMSPEACRGEADTSSDIWSLGITTAQMLSGELPYNVSEIEPHTFLYHLSKEREDFLPVIPDLIDEDAKEFIKSCVLLNNRPAADELLYHKFIVG